MKPVGAEIKPGQKQDGQTESIKKENAMSLVSPHNG